MSWDQSKLHSHRGFVLLDAVMAVVILGFAAAALVLVVQGWVQATEQQIELELSTKEHLHTLELHLQLQQHAQFLMARARLVGAL